MNTNDIQFAAQEGLSIETEPSGEIYATGASCDFLYHKSRGWCWERGLTWISTDTGSLSDAVYARIEYEESTTPTDRLFTALLHAGGVPA